MSEPVDNSTLIVGRISGCFGVKGWVKIHSYTDPVENFLGFGDYQLKHSDGMVSVEFDAGRRHGKGLVAHIKGVDDRTLAESYRGLEIAVAAAQLPKLSQGDYYWAQLQGLQVWCREGEQERVLLGTVDHLIDTGANDVLVVKAGGDSIDKQERLIPYLVDDVVTRVDLDAGLIEVDWFLEV